jgi:hypothetical protein
LPTSWFLCCLRFSPVEGFSTLIPIPHDVLTGSGCLREPLDPPVDAHVVDQDASFRKEYLDVPVGQAEPQVPADRQGDVLGREPIASERGTRGQAGTRVSVWSHRAGLSDGNLGDQCNSAVTPADSRTPVRVRG